MRQQVEEMVKLVGLDPSLLRQQYEQQWLPQPPRPSALEVSARQREASQRLGHQLDSLRYSLSPSPNRKPQRRP